jgi:hypothetical protein
MPSQEGTMQAPSIEYDEEGDILFINLALSEAETEFMELVHTLELDGTTGVVIQLGERDTPTTIEVFDASTRYPKSVLDQVKPKR